MRPGPRLQGLSSVERAGWEVDGLILGVMLVMLIPLDRAVKVGLHPGSNVPFRASSWRGVLPAIPAE